MAIFNTKYSNGSGRLNVSMIIGIDEETRRRQGCSSSSDSVTDTFGSSSPSRSNFTLTTITATVKAANVDIKDSVVNLVIVTLRRPNGPSRYARWAERFRGLNTLEAFKRLGSA